MIELRVLRYFLTVAREGTISKAADILHITQPTLSRQLTQMESDLGVELFRHQGRRLLLTSEGMLLRRRAEEIFELVDKTEQELLEQEEQLEGTVVVGHGEYRAMDDLADCMADFSKRYPHVRFLLFSATGDVIKGRMDRGLIDVGLVTEPIDVENYDYIQINGVERSGVFMRADDPLAQKEFITPEDLAGKPLMLPNRYQSQYRNWMGPWFEEKNIRYLGTLPTMGAILASKGLAYMIAVEDCLPFCDPAKLVMRPLEGNMHNRCLLAWKRGQPFSRAAEKFIEHAKCFLGMKEISD